MNSWPRNDYLQAAQEEGVTNETAMAAWQQATKTQRAGLPAVLSLKHLAVHTKMTYQHLRAVVARDVDPYRVFQLKKKSGGYRNICVPNFGLLRVQRWIDRFILSLAPPHERAKAYSPGSSILDCACEHAGCRWLIKCDVRQFFESISEIQVYRVFKQLGFEPLVSFEMARLTTRIPSSEKRYKLARWRSHLYRYKQIPRYHNSDLGHLPQGAPTSPKLSNLTMKGFDDRIENIAANNDVVYTRYADDLIFSAHNDDFDREKAKEVIGQVYREMRQIGLRPHTTKTTIVPPGARKMVLGLCVNDVVPRLTREFKKKIACHVHYVRRFGIVKHATNRGFDSVIGFREHLKGLLRYAQHVDADFAIAQREKLQSSDWERL